MTYRLCAYRYFLIIKEILQFPRYYHSTVPRFERIFPECSQNKISIHLDYRSVFRLDGSIACSLHLTIHHNQVISLMENQIHKTTRGNIDSIRVDWGKEVSFGVCKRWMRYITFSSLRRCL